MTKPRVLVLQSLTDDVEGRLARAFDADLREPGSNLSRDELLERIGSCDALCPSVVDSIDAALIRAAGKRLSIIANFGVGYENIDTAAAVDAGIVVTNTPGVLTDATADLAMTLLLMTARRAGEGERLVRRGRWQGWEPCQLLGVEVTGKTLGIVGFGRIGEAVARRAHAGFGMRVLVYSRSTVEPDRLAGCNARQCETLAGLLEQCDFVSLHCPATDETRHMIGEAALEAMPRHAVLINTARGALIDEAALARALANGVLRAAGLDVYENEPAVNPALLELDNVVLLPHLGSATVETRSAMGMRMLANLTDHFAGRKPRDRVA